MGNPTERTCDWATPNIINCLLSKKIKIKKKTSNGNHEKTCSPPFMMPRKNLTKNGPHKLGLLVSPQIINFFFYIQLKKTKGVSWQRFSYDLISNFFFFFFMALQKLPSPPSFSIIWGGVFKVKKISPMCGFPLFFLQSFLISYGFLTLLGKMGTVQYTKAERTK